jgi:ArsR family metal-binding transcriptional regulator
MSYLETISLTKPLPCLAEPGRLIVIGKPSRLLDEVVPYLATLPGVIAYSPETLTLTFRLPVGFLTLYPDKVYITQIKDAGAGLEALAALKDAINATWEGRSEQCGEATCLAFAVQLILQARILEECLPLGQDTAFADRKATLEAML